MSKIFLAGFKFLSDRIKKRFLAVTAEVYYRGFFCCPGTREIPADSEQQHVHIPVAKFRFDIGHIAKQILLSTSEAECKHLSLVVEGFETQLRVATLTRIADLISGVKPAEILPMRIDAVDVRITLQVGNFLGLFCGSAFVAV